MDFVVVHLIQFEFDKKKTSNIRFSRWFIIYFASLSVCLSIIDKFYSYSYCSRFCVIITIIIFILRSFYVLFILHPQFYQSNCVFSRSVL